MRTGVLLPHSLTAGSSHELVSWARTAEDLGFDSLGVRGRVVHDSLEPLVALSLVAASTRRIELVLSLTAPRLARPGILARQIAGLERASRGRLAVAVGADGESDPMASARQVQEHLDELPGRRTLVAASADVAARVLPLAGRGWVLTRGSAEQFAAGVLAVHDAWAFAGRPGHPRCLALVDVRGSEGAEVDAVRDALDAFERAGADEVLLEPASGSLRELERLAGLHSPALV
jgi:Luciferase-like monooxygenase